MTMRSVRGCDTSGYFIVVYTSSACPPVRKFAETDRLLEAAVGRNAPTMK